MSKAYNPKTGQYEVEREQFDDLAEKWNRQASARKQAAPPAITRAMVREVVDRAIHEYATYCMPPDADALLATVMDEQGEQQ